jgi:signal transduction histidine kinase
VGRLSKVLAANTLIAALYALLAGALIGWSAVPRSFAITLIYANVIGTSAHVLLGPLRDRLAAHAAWIRWLGVAVTLLAISVFGSLLAGTFAGALGLFGDVPFWVAQRTSLGIAIVLAMTVGMGIAVHESTRARLDEARERLRVRELEIERAHRLATDARLASLESRLHPHFLFNALAAIAGQVREAPDRAERLLVEFADLLRASLDATKRHTVPLGDEIAVVQSYLEIEHARLGERLRAKVEVPEELRAWPVPPLAVHTLVQNSVKHVAAARPAGAEIRVEVRRAGDLLTLSVWDDGPGFDLDAAPAGHGLETLRSRLAVLFGSGAALAAARGDGGARVTMSLPARPVVAERA